MGIFAVSGKNILQGTRQNEGERERKWGDTIDCRGELCNIIILCGDLS